MSHLEDYQTTKLRNLFNIEVIEEALDNIESLTAKQRAVLEFIVNNPDKQYINLQNTFQISDHLVVSLVLEYGTPVDEYDKLKELREKVR